MRTRVLTRFAAAGPGRPGHAARRAPADLAELGLLTNPVHVIDLSIVLPTLAVGAVALWRRLRAGYVTALTMLGFSVLMDVNIVVLTLFVGGPLAVTLALAAMTVASAVLLVLALRAVR